MILKGDSSGGHLALAVLSHIAHPHLQSGIPPLSLKENFRGALLLSPWVDCFELNSESVRRNATKDTISAKSLRLWARAIFGNLGTDNFSNPIRALVDWWKDIAVDRVFIGAGGDEVLLDSIVQIAHKIKVHFSCLRFDGFLMQYHT